MQKIEKQFLTTKSIFTVSIIVAVLTILSIWLFGLGQNRTLFQNSILSTSILSTAFFLFLAIGLYMGVKLKENIGSFLNKIKLGKIPDGLKGADIPLAAPDLGDDILGAVVGILVWLLFSFFLLTVIWVFGAVFWVLALVFIAMLYWIFYRALRLVFKNSNKCKNNLSKSILFGLGYTLLYNFWIYSFILATHYFVK